jgi:RND family efflux transporter MFP subunit
LRFFLFLKGRFMGVGLYRMTRGPLVRLWLGFTALAFVAAAWAQGVVAVPVAAVQLQSVASRVELDGLVQPVRQSTLSAQTPGRVLRLAVQAGDRVRAGQLLLVIDDRSAQAEVQRSQAQVAQAQAQWVQAQSQFERTRHLQTQGFVSTAALDAAQAQLQSAQAERDQAAAAAQQSALLQGFTQVSAPFDGWVLQTEAQVGDLALPGKALLTLYAPWPLRVVVQVPMSRLAQSGLLDGVVQIQLPLADGASQWVRPVTSTRLPMTDAVAQTVEWRFELPNTASGALAPGQQVRVQWGSAKVQRLMLPGTALLRRGELTAVYVAAPQGFVLKAVRLGADHGAAGVEVLAGLAAGDKVALDPIQAGMAGAKPAL